MGYEFSEAQKNRLLELGENSDINISYDNQELRQLEFMSKEKRAIKVNKDKLNILLNETHKPALCDLQERLAKALCSNGFTQVATPTIISAKMLEKMTINKDNPLYEQVFWLEGSKSCLRPMLAPNLYEVSKKLINIQKLPIRIFEIGSCFRKESEGRTHLKEFTMLNLVEWGTKMQDRTQRIKELSALVLEAAGIDDFCFEQEDSVVYGQGLDVVSPKGLELASTSMGPHPLDDAWKITCTWVGVGVGLERLLMHRQNEQGIHRYSRSNIFLDGACLKLK